MNERTHIKLNDRMQREIDDLPNKPNVSQSLRSSSGIFWSQEAFEEFARQDGRGLNTLI